MVLLRNLAVLIVVLLVNLVSCEHKEDPNCISTEGVKICSAAESSELSQDAHDAVLESGHSPSDNAGASLASEESAVNTKVTDVISNAGTEENSAERVSDTKISNLTETNTSSRTGSDNAAHPRTRSMEESSPVIEGNTSNQGSSAAVDTNTSVQVDSGEAGEGNVNKQENSVVFAVTNTTTRGTSVHDEANVSVQEGSVEIFDANVSKQESSIDVAEANTTKQENAVSNATMSESSPGDDEASSRKNADSGEAAKANISKQESSINVTEANSKWQDKSPVSTEENINIGNNSVVDAKGNALEGISANSSKQSLDILSNTTSETQIPERLVATNQTLENATEGLSRAESVVTAEGQETAGSSDTKAQTGDNASSPSKEAISDISSPELVAVAEGIVLASAVLQVATAKPPPATILDPAHEVALAEGLEIADAVLQAVKEDEPAVNAIWRATLEAESRMEQDNTPVNEEILDKGLMAFLVCVMVVLAITGSLSGWVLYTRLRRTPEEDQAQNMYILIDASDPQSNFVDCPLDINDSEGNSYTFPRVQNDMFS